MLHELLREMLQGMRQEMLHKLPVKAVQEMLLELLQDTGLCFLGSGKCCRKCCMNCCGKLLLISNNHKL